MTRPATFKVMTERDSIEPVLRHISNMRPPFVVTVKHGEPKRSDAMNKTIHLWFGEIASALFDRSAADVKAECNLIYGVPIKRRDDDEWAAAFGYIFDALNRPAKIKALRVLDIPVTRNMTVKQLGEYMEQMQRDYQEQGIRLTDPELRKYEGEGK